MTQNAKINSILLKFSVKTILNDDLSQISIERKLEKFSSVNIVFPMFKDNNIAELLEISGLFELYIIPGIEII